MRHNLLVDRLREAARRGKPDGIQMLAISELSDAADAIETLDAMQRHERQHREQTFSILMGIHNLLSPADVTTPEGKTYRFVFPEPKLANDLLAELSKRIRAIPDELARVP